VKHEMTWTLSWFANRESEWKRRSVWADTEHKPGHKCYAEKQIILWRRMHTTAELAWESVLNPGR
jgi:hypothetical protein